MSMRDIVQRLRSGVFGLNRIELCKEAADVIVSLRTELQAARSTPMAGAEPPKQGEAETEKVVADLVSALGAMLTQFGMDEDEWSKPTFDQARQAYEYARIVVRPMEPHERHALAAKRDMTRGWHERAVALGADGVDEVIRAAEIAKRRGELHTVDGCVSRWTFPSSPSPSVEPAPARQLVSVSSIDTERMIAECIPGGSICDPQKVADAIRNYCNAWTAPHQEPGWADSGNPLCNHDGQPACNGCLYMGECLCAPKEPKP